MIIKGIRLPAKQGIKRLVQHLYQGDENDLVRMVRGTPEDVADMHADARERGRTYSVRHWIVSPREATSEGQFRMVVHALAQEFGFETERAVVVEHAKRRAVPDAYGVHWHVLVGEVDPVSGRVLGSAHDFARHELLSRLFEIRTDQKIVPGPNSAAVTAELRRRGLNREADALLAANLANGPVGREAFSHAQHQEAKRKGIDLPSLRIVVRELWEATTDRAGFEHGLARAGLRLAVGTRAQTWIIEATDGTLVGAVDRLAGVRKRIVAERLDPVAKNTSTRAPTALAQDSTTHQHSDARRAIEAELATMEDEALLQRAGAEQVRDIIDGAPALQMAVSAADVRVQRARCSREAVERRFWDHKARSPRWWWLPVYRSRWHTAAMLLERQLATADIAVTDAQSAYAAAKIGMAKEERRVREARAEDVERRSELRRAADDRLVLIEHARRILAETPSIANQGLHAVLTMAQGQDGLEAEVPVTYGR